MSSSKMTVMLVVVTMMNVLTLHNVNTVSAFTASYTCRPHQRVLTPFTVVSVATDPIIESSDASSLSTTSDSVEAEAESVDVTIPTNLPSECGMDYVPLASMLATGQLAEADQVIFSKLE